MGAYKYFSKQNAQKVGSTQLFGDVQNHENDNVQAHKKSNVVQRIGVGFGVLTVSSFAFATTPPDLTPIVTMITGLVAVVASVGMAVLTVYATAKVFKWVKTAF